MTREAVTTWIADWMGRSKTVKKGDNSISPLQVLSQASAVLAVLFAEPIAGFMVESLEPEILFVIRLALLMAVSLMAHHVIIAKDVLERTSITASSTPVPAVPDKSTVAPAEKGVAGLSQPLNSPDQSVSRYDFFIAYATPDRRLAQDLCWFLQDDACEVFLDVQDLSPGAVWPPALGEALKASRAIVVLVSTHTNDAFYQQEEIARAIQLARDKPSVHTVIPVILEKLPQGAVSIPYGMSSLQAQDATRPGGLKRVATELVAWLKDHQHNTKQPQMANAMIETLESAEQKGKVLLVGPGEEPSYRYKYSEVNRLASKLTFVVALLLVAVISWPRAMPCQVRAHIENAGTLGSHQVTFSYIEISGSKQTRQFPLSETGKAEIEIAARQRKNWTLTLVQPDGSIALKFSQKGCPDAKQNIPLGPQSTLVLQPG